MSYLNYRLLVSPQAQEDIIGILRYTGETWGQDQLLIYSNKLNEAIQTIGQNPEIGHRSSDLPATHRLYFIGSHVVVYRIRDEAISIVRILHQRMSLKQNI